VTTGNSRQDLPNTTQHQASENKIPDAETLDFQFYQRACELAGESASTSAFEAGRKEGKFRFTEDATLLNSLLTLYGLNLHQIAGEWTVFSNKPGQVTVFATSPLEAVITWVVSQPLALLTG
jgi:hypothetical protein